MVTSGVEIRAVTGGNVHARIMKNKKNLIAMIYLIAGRLDSSPTHPVVRTE
jgi:hypothetical protein